MYYNKYYTFIVTLIAGIFYGLFADGADPISITTAHDEQLVDGSPEYCVAPTDTMYGLFPTSGLNSKSDFPTINLTGFFQADAAWFLQSSDNIDTLGDIQDGADFRRARLAATGKVAENVAYMIEFDFGFPGRPSFMDVWLELQDLPAVQNIRVGHFRAPFGLDGQVSAKELTFIERGLPFAFYPFRQIGAMASGTTEDELTTYSLFGFRFPTDQFGGQIGDNGGYGMASRLTHLLADGDDFAFHIGGAYSVIDPANDAVQYRSQPEIFIAETGGASLIPPGAPNAVPPFVNTGTISTNLAHLFSAELAGSSGPFHAQAEYVNAYIQRLSGSDVSFYGVSAQVAWILTGEHRPYNKKNGVLGRVVPAAPFGTQGLGAWEVAARYSFLDLTDNDVQGGELQDLTLGLNWYLNRYTKFQFNYIHAMLDDATVGQSDADIWGMRAQLDF